MMIGSECRSSVGSHGGGELLPIEAAVYCFALAVGLAFLIGGSPCPECIGSDIWPELEDEFGNGKLEMWQ